MKLPAILKTLYHYTIGCCCGSALDLDTPEDETFLLVEVGHNALQYHACLNDTVRVEVTGEHQEEESKNAESTRQVEPVELGFAEDEIKEEDDVKQADDDRHEEPALPTQASDPVPEPELNVEEPEKLLHLIFKEDFVPGMFLPKTDGKLVQDRFGLSTLEYLKSGSYGDVFKARDEAKQKFAVKVVCKRGYAEGKADTWLQETEKELKFLVRAKHENIVQLHDYFWIKHTIEAEPTCLVMKTERLDFTLEDVLKKIDAPLDRLATIRLAKQLGAALCHLHQCKIVNHDVKAENVMMNRFKSINRPTEKLMKYLSKDCGFKMIDLGLGEKYSGEVGDCKDSTEIRFRKGALKYRCLEKRINDSYEPFAADCFAFAVVLLEAMMGHKAFEREYNSKCKKIFDPITDAVKAGARPYNFIRKIAQEFFDDREKTPRMNPINFLVLHLLDDEPKRWNMDQAMERLNIKYATIL